MVGILIALQIVFLFLTRIWQPPVLIDDAHIHFRVAWNFAAGDGLLYNVGERVLATTSPIYAALLGLMHLITQVDIPSLSKMVNFATDVGTSLIIFFWLRGAGVLALGATAVVLVTLSEPHMIYHSVGGMEMSLYVFVSVVIIDLMRRRRWLACGALLGILGWIRPEGVALGAGVLVAISVTGPRSALLRVTGAAFGSAVCMGLALWIHCGDVVPLSVRIKSTAPWFTDPEQSSASLNFLALGELTPLSPFARHYAVWGSTGAAVHAALLSVLQIALTVVGACRLWRSPLKPVGVALLIWGVGHWLFHALTNPFHVPWYPIPLLFVAMLLGWLGLWDAARWALERLGQRLPRRFGFRAVAPGLAACLILPLGLIVSANTAGIRAIAFEGMAFRGEGLLDHLLFRCTPLEPSRREFDYERAADFLNQLGDDQERPRVGLWEIGVTGYHYRGPVLDSYGLVSPEVLEWLQTRRDSAPSSWSGLEPLDAVMALQPEVIAHSPFFPVFPPPEFFEIYARMDVPEIALLFYVRRDFIRSLPPDAQEMIAQSSAPGR